MRNISILTLVSCILASAFPANAQHDRIGITESMTTTVVRRAQPPQGPAGDVKAPPQTPVTITDKRRVIEKPIVEKLQMKEKTR